MISPLDNYLQGWVRVEVCGRFRSSEVKPRYWVAVFERYEQQTALVNVVECADDPERHRAGLAPADYAIARSHVRLAFFEKPEDLGIADRRLEIGGRKCLPLFAEGRVANGELSLLPRSAVLTQYQLPREMVECRAKAIDDFADLERPIGIDRGNPVYSTDVILGLRIKLDAESMSLGVKRAFDALLQIGRVGLRPVDFAI